MSDCIHFDHIFADASKMSLSCEYHVLVARDQW
jgi:hypothetical protein